MPVAMMSPGMTWKDRGKRPAPIISALLVHIIPTVLTLEITLDLEASIAEPLGDQEAPGQHPLKQATELSTILGSRDFGTIHGNNSREEADGNTSNEPTRDHHWDVLGATLKSTAKDRNESTNEDCSATSKLVGQPGH